MTTVPTVSPDPSRKNPEPPGSKTNLSEDLKTFEELPAGTRELHLLADESEKATGKDRADVDRKIKRRSGLANP